jgi:protein-disulfide isomerase
MKLSRFRPFAIVAAIMLMAGFSGVAQAFDAKSLAEPPTAGEMALGPEDAKVTIIEYASVSCPHCAAFHKDVFPALKRDYVDTGKVRFVFRDFPLNQAALAGAMIARCAPKEKYFPIIDALFETQQVWMKKPADELFKVAQLAGFTRASFDACLKNEAVAKGIVAIRDRATQEFEVKGTPTIFINGERYAGPRELDKIKAAIDPLLGQ